MHTGSMLDDSAPTADERAAMRAFLQRSDVRLGTIHRVGTALLSGAGLMVLLPAVQRDSFVSVIRALVAGDLDAVHILLAIAMTVMVALPIVALWILVRELTRFYFHANHIQHETGEAFTPRFTLTALRLPADELGERTTADLEAARADSHAVELLVPSNEESRRRIDRELAAYGLGITADDPASQEADTARATALFELVASRPRTLAEEVAKIEFGLARHVMRAQVVVLRYVKALLALLTTAMAVFAAAAVVDGLVEVRPPDMVWLASIVMAWAPGVVFAVTSPVRWLERLLRNEGATHTAVADDPEFTLVERISIRMAAAGWLFAAVGMFLVLPDDAVTPEGQVAGTIVAVVSVAALVATLLVGDGRRTLRRLALR